MIIYETDLEIEQELQNNPPKIPAFAGRHYPIEYLDSREFEVLIYFLFKHDIAQGLYTKQYDSVMLMKGTAEKGRDSILRYGGKNVGAVQCKRYINLVTVPDLCRELIKFCIHALVDSDLISDQDTFTYHFTALKGLNEKAVEFIKTLNSNLIGHVKFREWVEEVIEENAGFNELKYETIEVGLKIILGKIKFNLLTGTDIDGKLKNAKEVLAIFFEVEKVADESMLHKVFGQYFDFKNDEDLNRLREQIKDIPEDKRMNIGQFAIYGYNQDYYKNLMKNKDFLYQVADLTLTCSTRFIDYLGAKVDEWILLFITGRNDISPFTKQLAKPYLFNKYARINHQKTAGEIMYKIKPAKGIVEELQAIQQHKAHLLKTGQQVLDNDYSSWVGDDDIMELKKKVAAFIHQGFSTTTEMNERFDLDIVILQPILDSIEERIQKIMPVNPTIVIHNHSPLNTEKDLLEMMNKAGQYN